MLKPRTKMILIPLLFLGLMAAGVAAVLTATFQIQNQARLVTINIGVYRDITATNPCTLIDWGTLNPGQTKTVTVYIKNTGNGNMTGSFSLSNWSPSQVSNYISLQWNFGSNVLLPGRIRPTNFTLTVSSGITGITSFSFTITVTATQA